MQVPAMATTGLGARLTVDLGALRRNWQALDKVSQGALTGAVVKADAYGTGLIASARALYHAGARFFFCATPDEAVALRAALPDIHIFVLDGLFPGAAALYVGERLMPAISSLPMLEEWLQACLARNESLPAALHFDTGMNRLGFRLNEATIVKRMITQIGYSPQMIMSHLACADVPAHEKNRTQLALFTSVMAHFPGIPASLANSAGLMTSRETHFQMVRPGIALYGGRAVSGRRNPMQPVVRVEAPVLQVKEARTGETVGYGATQTLARDSRLAIVGIGYADGLLRGLSATQQRPGARMVIRNRFVPVIGRISMDTTIVDVTDLGHDLPAPGEMAEVLGDNIGVDEHADLAGTIGYEILTGLKGRYLRRYAGAEGFGTEGF
jgi:alanine racemase